MKHQIQLLSLLLSLFPLIHSQSDFLSEQKPDELLFVFEVTRHGARTGLHNDLYNTSWFAGELTGVGARQHYLIGRQIRHKYIDQMNYLKPEYDPRQIFIRSTCTNRTIESAYSQLLGIYPPSSNTQKLYENQTLNWLPQFNISQEIIDSAQHDLGSNALPFNFQPIPVHSFDCDNDYFQPRQDMCPAIGSTREKREQSPEHEAFMNEKFNSTLKKLAQALNFNPQNFTAHVACQYVDSINARYYEQEEIAQGLNEELLKEMMDMYFEYYNFTMAMNETTRRVYLTGVLSEFIDRSQEIIDFDMSNELNIENWKKFFFYSDHDDSIVSIADAFNHPLSLYPPFASVIIFELWRKDNSYFVNLTINDDQINIQQDCNNATQCRFDLFKEVVRKNTFFEDEQGYMEVCGQTNAVFDYYEFGIEDVILSQTEDNFLYSKRRGKYFPEYSRFLICYCVNLILAILVIVVGKKVFYAHKPQRVYRRHM